MSIVVVVGNRPQFIKFAPIARAFGQASQQVHVIHSGQHYDDDMSGVFFRDLGLLPPNETYSTSNSSHARMTADMLVRLEESLMKQQPKGVIVFGDTNTTLAAVLAASKLGIQIAHVEAGPRTGDKSTPEEQNRIIADHLSHFRFCPDPTSVSLLAHEGIREGVVLSGDTMLDAYKLFANQTARQRVDLLQELGVAAGRFTLLTVHRPINTDSKEAISGLVRLLRAWKEPIVFPMHPRTRQALERHQLLKDVHALTHVHIVSPRGYIDMVSLLHDCRLVATDSGGLQKEAYFAGKPCLTLDKVTPWPMLRDDGWITLTGALEHCSPEDLAQNAFSLRPPASTKNDYFGSGDAALIIRDTLMAAGWCS
jgi:UDP-GlcNAc3NAcA epimerase